MITELQNAEGILNINKPKGITSFDVVRKVRYKLGIQKVGHCGSLDPIATGVLLICFGGATKKSKLMMDLRKCYKGVFKLGVKTDTDDITGNIISEMHDMKISKDKIEEEMKNFIGDISQKVPLYSAAKVKGRCLYAYARKGLEVELPVKRVKVNNFELLDYNYPFVCFSVSCSKGTYVRGLARDIGDNLGCGATLFELTRTEIGSYTVDQSLDLNWLINADYTEVLSKRINI
ncbi:MAG: tRNA pseudouridine(55) synthase TruB [bacterium]